MITMREFKLDLNGTPEEQERLKNGEKFSSVTVVVEMPANAVIRRINTRIMQIEKTGIHPETRQFGKFLVGEECVYIWAECSDSYDVTSETFRVIPTGGAVPPDLEYVGTFLLHGGMFVFHMYGPEVD